MFYGQCFRCKERWEFGTASTCKCPYELPDYKFKASSDPRLMIRDSNPVSNIAFYASSPTTEVMRISRSGVWVNPDLPVDETAKHVITALDVYIKNLIDGERERIIAANAPELERLSAHIKELEHQAARYRELRTWDLGGYDYGLYSPEEVDKAVDGLLRSKK